MAEGDNNRIREWVVENLVDPARQRGAPDVTVVAGDVHARMGLVERMPAVCSALDARKFLEMAGVALHRRSGPEQGPKATWVFRFGR